MFKLTSSFIFNTVTTDYLCLNKTMVDFLWYSRTQVFLIRMPNFGAWGMWLDKVFSVPFIFPTYNSGFCSWVFVCLFVRLFSGGGLLDIYWSLRQLSFLLQATEGGFGQHQLNGVLFIYISRPQLWWEARRPNLGTTGTTIGPGSRKWETQQLSPSPTDNQVAGLLSPLLPLQWRWPLNVPSCGRQNATEAPRFLSPFYSMAHLSR